MSEHRLRPLKGTAMGASSSSHGSRPLHTVRVPRAVASKPVGVGTAIRRATSALGVGACGGCRARAERLDRLVQLAPRDRAPHR